MLRRVTEKVQSGDAASGAAASPDDQGLLIPQPDQSLPNDPTSQAGQSVTEYALVIGVVGLVVIIIFWMIGPQLAAVFSSIYTEIVAIPTVVP